MDTEKELISIPFFEYCRIRDQSPDLPITASDFMSDEIDNNLGLKFIKYERRNNLCIFEVIDKHKYFLIKIKYGF